MTKYLKFTLILILFLLISCAGSNRFLSFAGNVTLRVTGVGETLSAAQKSGFRDAIQQAYGTLTLSERRVTNDNLFEDDVSYAKGIIENYQVLATNKDPGDGLYRITMLVTVSPSLIQKRILDAQDSSQIDGAKIRNQILNGQAQASSEKERLTQSKRLFQHFTKNLVKTLFEVKNGDIRTVRNAQDISTYIEVKVSVSSKSLEDLCTISKEYQKTIGEVATNNGWNLFELRMQPCGFAGWSVLIEKDNFFEILSSLRDVGICVEVLDRSASVLMKFFQDGNIIEDGYPKRKFGVSAYKNASLDRSVILITRGNWGNDVLFEVPLPSMSPNLIARITEIRSTITDKGSCS